MLEKKGLKKLDPNPPASVFKDSDIRANIKRGMQIAAGYKYDRHGSEVSDAKRKQMRREMMDYNRAMARTTIALARLA